MRGKMINVRMLILGGTRFVGYTVLEAAIRAGWDVTSPLAAACPDFRPPGHAWSRAIA